MGNFLSSYQTGSPPKLSHIAPEIRLQRFLALDNLLKYSALVTLLEESGDASFLFTFANPACLTKTTTYLRAGKDNITCYQQLLQLTDPETQQAIVQRVNQSFAEPPLVVTKTVASRTRESYMHRRMQTVYDQRLKVGAEFICHCQREQNTLPELLFHNASNGAMRLFHSPQAYHYLIGEIIQALNDNPRLFSFEPSAFLFRQKFETDGYDDEDPSHPLCISPDGEISQVYLLAVIAAFSSHHPLPQLEAIKQQFFTQLPTCEFTWTLANPTIRLYAAIQSQPELKLAAATDVMPYEQLQRQLTELCTPGQVSTHSRLVYFLRPVITLYQWYAAKQQSFDLTLELFLAEPLNACRDRLQYENIAYHNHLLEDLINYFEAFTPDEKCALLGYFRTHYIDVAKPITITRAEKFYVPLIRHATRSQDYSLTLAVLKAWWQQLDPISPLYQNISQSLIELVGTPAKSGLFYQQHIGALNQLLSLYHAGEAQQDLPQKLLRDWFKDYLMPLLWDKQHKTLRLYTELYQHVNATEILSDPDSCSPQNRQQLNRFFNIPVPGPRLFTPEASAEPTAQGGEQNTP